MKGLTWTDLIQKIKLADIKARKDGEEIFVCYDEDFLRFNLVDDYSIDGYKEEEILYSSVEGFFTSPNDLLHLLRQSELLMQ